MTHQYFSESGYFNTKLWSAGAPVNRIVTTLWGYPPGTIVQIFIGYIPPVLPSLTVQLI